MNTTATAQGYKRVLSELKPQRVFYHFENLCRIPHGSGNEEGVSKYCEAVANANGLKNVRDARNNVVIYCPASKGYEKHPTVIIQGHLDMVCAKRPGSPVDMSKDPLKLKIYGDSIGAEDTSLGGDDGIAVAISLALIEDKDIPHPPLEILLTTDEEVGMTGASALDGKLLSGRLLINLDSEEEGVFTVGCAGGLRVYTSTEVKRTPFKGEYAELTISGLIGGHSGAEINKGRANSNVLMGKLLKEISAATDIHLCRLEGGERDNVITSHTAAAIMFEKRDCAAVIKAVSRFRSEFRKEFGNVESGGFIGIGLYGYKEGLVLDTDSTRRTVSLLSSLPYGAHKMSPDVEGLVQTSSNVGVVKLDSYTVKVNCSVRSSVTVERDELAYSIVKLAKSCGFSAERVSPYPAWEYRKSSHLRDVMSEVYKNETGKEPEISVIHAGLECGLLSQKLPGLDAVSIGPDMRDIHSYSERLNIASVGRTWKFVLDVLAAL